MLGRSTARVLRSTPQHKCLPCLRRQLLHPIAAQSPSLAAFRPAQFHTTAAVRDQLQSERSNPLADDASTSPPHLDDSAASADTGGEVDEHATGTENESTMAATRQSTHRKRRRLSVARRKPAGNDSQQQAAQDQNLENKTFIAGQLENHASLSEALGNQTEGKKELARRMIGHKASLSEALGSQSETTKKLVRRIGHKQGTPVVLGRREAAIVQHEASTIRIRKKKSDANSSPKNKDNTAEDAKKTTKSAKSAKSAKPAKSTKSKKKSEDETREADSASVEHRERLSAQELHLTPLDVEQPPVPALAYDLDRVLFNPGVYHLQDPRTQVFNFDPYLSNVMPVAEFNFNSLGEYITSSRDSSLSDLAREHQKTFVGSTSSMTSSLAHFHYLLSCWRPVNISMLSKAFPEKLTTFTRLNRLPASIFLRYKDGVYSIDADKEFDSSNILAMLGKSLEKLLTLPTEEYERYRVTNPNQISEEERQQPESYHYTSMGDILMRSQLDAQDSRLPGTGMYDLKTRAVVSIRMDVQSWDQNTGYQIKRDIGQFESYEREYYDMMRSMMLKYSLQARMGRMDGIFVAYHNIERIFGFQYISLEEMDRGLHGTKEGREVGDQEFRLSIGLLNKILREAIEKFPETSLRIQFETRESQASPWMYIFAEPMTEDEIQAIQDSNKAEIQAFEERVLGLESDESGEGEDAANVPAEEAAEQDATTSVGTVEEGVNATPVIESDAHADENVDAVGEAISEEVEKSTTSEEVQATQDEMSPTSPEGASQDEVAPTSPEGATQDEMYPTSPEGATQDEMSPTSPEGASQDEMSPTSPEGATQDEMDPTSPEGATQDGMSVEDRTPPDVDADNEEVPGSAAQKDFPEAEDSQDGVGVSGDSSKGDSNRPLLALKLFVTNRVNGEPVQRPDNLGENSNWTVDYSIREVESREKAEALYRACRKRRADGFAMSAKEASGDKVLSYYQKLLRRLSAQGRVWRTGRDKELERQGKVVFQSRGEPSEPQRLGELDTYLSWLYSRGTKGRDD